MTSSGVPAGRQRPHRPSGQAPATVPVVVAVTQVIAWGATFYPVSVLAPRIADGIGAPVTAVSAAPTVLLVGTAVMSIPTARLLTRYGARQVTSIGTLIGALGLGLVALAPSLWLYLTGWLVAGLAGAAMLTLGAQVSIAEFRPHTARRDLRLMMLATCLPPALFWPLTQALSPYGWQVVFATYAGLLLVGALALFLFLPRRREAPSDRADDPTRDGTRTPPGPPVAGPPISGRRLVPLVAGISLNGFVSGGLPLVFIPLFVAAGLETGVAVTISSALGIIQAAARALTLALRIPAITEVLVASGVMLTGVLALLLLPHGGAGVGIVAVVLFGTGAGIIAVARAVLPYELFDPVSYARVSGMISLPLNLVFALAPAVFAALLTAGAVWAVALAVVLIAAAVGCLVVLRVEVGGVPQR